MKSAILLLPCARLQKFILEECTSESYLGAVQSIVAEYVGSRSRSEKSHEVTF